MSIDLISFGIVIDDIVLPDGTTHNGILGGGGPQTAWGMAAALGTGETVGLVAEVGADFAPQSLAPLKNARINLDGVRTTSGFTPHALQRLDAEGSRTHIWIAPPLKSITFGSSIRDLLPENYRGARGFHWGLHPENPAVDEARTLTAQRARVSLETFKPPDRPLDPHALRALVASCAVFSPNWSEAAAMVGSTDYETIIHAFQAAGCHVLALRRGSKGADIWDFATRKGVRVPAVPAHVVDTVGAGNAFCGALLATMDQGVETAACHAAAAASFLVEQFGLPPRPPDPVEFSNRLAFARGGLVYVRFP